MTAERDALISAARAGRERAYAPYSNYRVGAGILTDIGVFSGCNVENASYGLSICAERTAIFSAIAGGAKEILAVAVMTQDGGFPCGACRQVLAEFAHDDCPVLLLNENSAVTCETTLGALFPNAFRLQ